MPLQGVREDLVGLLLWLLWCKQAAQHLVDRSPDKCQ